MLEVFIHFKVRKILPIEINKITNSAIIFDSFTFFALKPFVERGSMESKIKDLMSQEAIRFILNKADIIKKDIIIFDISSEELAKSAFEIAKKAKGRFVTAMDVFVAYLLLSEEKSKLLFNKNLKEKDLLNILYWARKANSLEEKGDFNRSLFWGEGIGENWVSGWTPETEKYVIDITSDIFKKKPLFLGRREEYKQAVEGIYRKKGVLLVGETGSGKDSLVEALAYESFVGDLKYLYHQRFFQLLADTLIAGSDNQGVLQSRIDSVIEEVAHAGNVVLFIPDIENILGSSTFNMDLSGILIPYMKRGNLKIIATITPSSYKKFVEPRLNLLDVFEVVRIEEPSNDIVFQMLLEKTLEIENSSNVSISYKAVVEALSLSDEYLQNRVKPGSSVRLLKDTVAEVKMMGKTIVEDIDVVNKVKTKTKILIGMPDEKEKKLLLFLENEIHKYVVDQKDAIFAIAEAMRRVRAGLTSGKKPISFLFLGPTGVGKTATAKTFSSLYFGENKMIRFDMSEYASDESSKRLLGGLSDGDGITDKVYNNPFSLILLDEFEKSASAIQDLFLQVLDDGRLTDNKGKTVSFVNSIIIATSNAASEFIREEVRKGTEINRVFKAKLLEFLQEKGIFKPELLNRFDDIIIFKPLGVKEINEITKLMLDDLSKRLLEKDIAVSFDEKVITKIVKEGFDEEFGARPIRRFIQDNIEDRLAQKMLKGEIKKGNKVLFSTDSANIITLSVL